MFNRQIRVRNKERRAERKRRQELEKDREEEKLEELEKKEEEKLENERKIRLRSKCGERKIDKTVIIDGKCICRCKVCEHCGEEKYVCQIKHAMVEESVEPHKWHEMIGCDACIKKKQGMKVPCWFYAHHAILWHESEVAGSSLEIKPWLFDVGASSSQKAAPHDLMGLYVGSRLSSPVMEVDIWGGYRFGK